MLDLHFRQQISRLVSVYGDKAFPEERVKLIHRAVIDLDHAWLETLVNHMIGSLRQPPILTDFREAAMKERHKKFNQDVCEAINVWENGKFEGLKPLLKTIGAKTLAEAVELEKQKIRTTSEETT